MTLEAMLTLAVAVTALAAKPGAGMMMVMSRTISGGMAACLTFVLGFCIVSLLFLGLVLFGYKYFEGVDIIFISIFIKSFAAVYLIWLGFKGIQSAQEKFYLHESKVETFFENLTASLMLTLSNPLTIVFYAGILPTVLDVSALKTSDMLTAAIVICVVELVVAVAYSLPFVLFRHKMKQEFMQGLKLFSSIIIIGVGLYIGYTAISSEALLSVF